MMYTEIQMKRPSENPIITIRLNEAEHTRFTHLMDAAKSRNPYIGRSDVVRELLGLIPPFALTEDELHFFRTGEKTAPKKGMKFAGIAHTEEPKASRKAGKG